MSGGSAPGCEDPRLLVGVPTYERVAYIGQCLGSIEAQTYRDFRVLVVDNNSRQDYSSALARFSEKRLGCRRGVEYIRQARNVGSAANIATVLQMRNQAPFLMAFNDDDLMHPRMLEWQMSTLESDPTVAFVACEFAAFDDRKGPPTEIWDRCAGRYEVYEQADLARILLRGSSLSFGSVVYRSAALEGKVFDLDRFSMIFDRPFLLDVVRGQRCALIREPLVFYRTHPSQDSRSDVLSERNIIELTLAYRAALPATWSRADENLFMTHSTNNLLDSYTRLAGNRARGLPRFIGRCRREGLFRWRSLRALGVAALLGIVGLGAVPKAVHRARNRAKDLASRTAVRSG